MKKRRGYPDDDGHVVADMSGVERPRLFMPGPGGRPAQDKTKEDKPWESTLTPEERRMTVLAAVKAALLIGLVFIAGIGAVILLMVLFW